MYRSYEAYGSTRKKNRTKKAVFVILKYAAILFIIHFVIINFFISSFDTNSISMRPLLEPADRVFTSPLLYGIKLPLFFKNFRGIEHLDRGDVVIVKPPYYPEESFFLKTFGPVMRFFTFQLVNPVKDSQGNPIQPYMIKRVIGLPGDTLYLKEYTTYIKPKGENSFKTERDLIPLNYTINANSPVANWPSQFPFAGNMTEITLRENEYFLLGDNRPYASDSRSWGAISADKIIGKVFLRYWPFSRVQKF
jgi:signal peptidase I